MMELITMGPGTVNEDFPLNEEGIDKCLNVQDTPLLGRCRAFLYKDHNPRITIGPHWPLWILAVTAVTSFALYYSVMMYYTKHYMIATTAIILLLINLAANFLTALSNPGIPSRDLSTYSVDTLKSVMHSLSYCRICKVIKDPSKQIYHCTACDVCVEGYDHHCPWISKCVGKGNARYFYSYIASTLGLFLFLIISASFLRSNN